VDSTTIEEVAYFDGELTLWMCVGWLQGVRLFRAPGPTFLTFDIGITIAGGIAESFHLTSIVNVFLNVSLV
jgi:hypothetical protein